MAIKNKAAWITIVRVTSGDPTTLPQKVITNADFVLDREGYLIKNRWGTTGDKLFKVATKVKTRRTHA